MLELFVLVLVIVLLAMTWQQFRYLRIRRNAAQDWQHLLHSGDVFHVMVFFKLKSGDKVIDTSRRFTQRIVSTSRARLIYAGQSAFTVSSQQLGHRDWDGVLLFEYPSRSDYEESRTLPETGAARQLFADTYMHGMRRNRRISSSIPLLLLRRRMKDLLIGRWRIEPLQASAEFATSPEYEVWRARISRLQALHEINRHGLVVYNLVKYGTAGFQGTVDTFGSKLLSRMAAMDHGPLHIGRSVALEEFARFDRVYIVYYPSARYLSDLIASQHFHSIVGNSRIADIIRVPTVPITQRV